MAISHDSPFSTHSVAPVPRADSQQLTSSSWVCASSWTASQIIRSGNRSGTTAVPHPGSIPVWRILSIPLIHTLLYVYINIYYIYKTRVAVNFAIFWPMQYPGSDSWRQSLWWFASSFHWQGWQRLLGYSGPKALRSIRRRFAVHLPVALPRQSHNVKWMQPSAFARHFNLDVSPCL